jgi:hypothetical protein
LDTFDTILHGATGRIHAVLHEFLDVDGFADVLAMDIMSVLLLLDSFAVANAIGIDTLYSVGYGLEQVLV